MAYKNMCDNRADCKDESDECLCEGAVKISCFQGDYEVTKCISPHLYWNDCSGYLRNLGCRNLPDPGDCEDGISSGPEDNFIAKCFGEYSSTIFHIYYQNMNNKIYNTTEIFCNNNCTVGEEGQKWEHFCNRVILSSMTSVHLMFMFV